MNTVQTLNALRDKHGECSDYRLAKILGCSRQTVSMWRTAHRTMDENYRLKAAELLNEDPALHLLYGELERAKCTDLKQVWQGAIQKLTSTAAAIILGLTVTLTPADATAKQLNNNETRYTLCAVIRWLKRYLWLDNCCTLPFLIIIKQKDLL